MTKDSDFRQWLRQKWFEYQDEIDPFRNLIKDVLSQREYFTKYKWFLKQLYRKEKANGHTGNYDN